MVVKARVISHLALWAILALSCRAQPALPADYKSQIITQIYSQHPDFYQFEVAFWKPTPATLKRTGQKVMAVYVEWSGAIIDRGEVMAICEGHYLFEDGRAVDSVSSNELILPKERRVKDEEQLIAARNGKWKQVMVREKTQPTIVP
jgi:hypothetical protein